ncbi:MAG: hypothetical protein ACOYOP_11745 [Microthrixaceae bacterium]
MVLVPTLVLVVMMLAALAIDAAALRAEQARARAITESAADDAAAMIDTRRVQRDGAVVIDGAAAERTALAHLRNDGLPGLLHSVEVRTAADRVEVRVRVEVRRVLLGVVPGVDRTTIVPVRAEAHLDPPPGTRP